MPHQITFDHQLKDLGEGREETYGPVGSRVTTLFPLAFEDRNNCACLEAEGNLAGCQAHVNEVGDG